MISALTHWRGLRDLRGERVREDEMSVREAALLLGVSDETVRRRFDEGEITGRRTKPSGGGWRILDRASVEAYGRRQRGEEHTDG